MARKSKEFLELFYEDSPQKQPTLAKKTKNKLQRKREKEAFKRFKEKLESNPDNQNKLFIENPKHLRKMSEVLIDFIQPFLDDVETSQQRTMLVEIAIMAWNVALLPEETREEFLQQMLSSKNNQGISLFTEENSETKEEFQRLMKRLIKRKLKYFAEENRFVTDFQVTEDTGHFHISVASSPIQPPTEVE
ncbi:MAG: hypothetical protein VKJ02_10110 [Snowella sp.]|nr:hypothetical protein [Snowella sp.]